MMQHKGRDLQVTNLSSQNLENKLFLFILNKWFLNFCDKKTCSNQ